MLAEAGCRDLELSYNPFPLIKLENEGRFEDTEGKVLGEDFDCIIQTVRAKYLLKNTKCDKKDDAVAYSYDLKVESEGDRPLSEIIAEWSEQGWGYETKTYFEASALMVGGENDGNMVMLSIPPTSKARISGFFYQNALKHGLAQNQYVTKCKCGDKVKTAEHPFYPWNFEFVKAL